MRETIFLSGTDEMSGLLSKVNKKLKEQLEYNVYFYKEEFPIEGTNAIEECFKNVKKADKFLLVIGKRYGHIYEKEVSMIEKEFNIARREKKPTLVFIRDEIYHKISAYRGYKEEANMSDEELSKICRTHLIAEKDVYDFLLKIEDSNIWHREFNSLDDIIEGVKKKFGIAKRSKNNRLFKIFYIEEGEAKFLKDLEEQIGIKIGFGHFEPPPKPYDSFFFDKIGITLSPNNKISGIGLSNVDLPHIPESISNLRDLSTLILHNVNLQKIPSSIFTFPLSHISLSYNKITKIPKSISKLGQIAILDLNDNQITDIKPLNGLDWISNLDLSNNQIQEIEDLQIYADDIILKNNPLNPPPLKFFIEINEMFGDHDIEFPLEQVKTAEVRSRDRILRLINVYKNKKGEIKAESKRLRKWITETLKEREISEEEGKEIGEKFKNLSKKTEKPISGLIDIGYPAVKVLVECYNTENEGINPLIEEI